VIDKDTRIKLTLWSSGSSFSDRVLQPLGDREQSHCLCGRPRGIDVQMEVVVGGSQNKETSVDPISRIGMDTSKHISQLFTGLRGLIAGSAKQLRRKDMVAFFANLPPTVIAIEACGASHHCARC